MIGRVEETSASFEARSAPRLYPTEGLGVQFPGPTRHFRPNRPGFAFGPCRLRSGSDRSAALPRSVAMCQKPTHAVQQKRRHYRIILSALAGTTSCGRSTILGSRMVKVD